MESAIQARRQSAAAISLTSGYGIRGKKNPIEVIHRLSRYDPARKGKTSEALACCLITYNATPVRHPSLP